MNDFSNLIHIDKIANLERFSGAIKPILTQISRQILDDIRQDIIQGKKAPSEDEIIEKIAQGYAKFERESMQKVINASGVVIHTNLGRSVIDESIFERAKSQICAYSNLEYDLIKGCRGNRYDYSGRLLATLFGCEDAVVLNNNASAVFLVLNTFCKDKDTIISRGELVEIGGGFRVPEVMKTAGTRLIEVGTTNKTKISDYESQISENTAMLLKVHRSNFDMVGFTDQVKITELVKIAQKSDLLSYYDLGSGYTSRLNHGLEKDEPSIQKVLDSGVDLLSFSGDKLFGSVQCGIVLGKKALISRLRQNQLLRMLRVDKVNLALLNETIKAYLNKNYDEITTLRLINRSADELENLAKKINQILKNPLEIIKSQTFVGGGSLPNKIVPTIALVVDGNAINLEKKFRQKNIIGRIENEKFLLDLRSILDSDIAELVRAIGEMSDE